MVALSALSATAGTLYQAAAPAMVRETVPEDELTAANALLSTVDTLAFVAGPAAGSLLMLIGEPPVAFAVNAATFGSSALFLFRIGARSRPANPAEGRGVLLDLAQGATAFFGNRTVAVLTGCVIAASAVYGAELVVLVLVSTELLTTGTTGLGWLQAASGAGGVLGAALSGRLAAATRARMTIALTVLFTVRRSPPWPRSGCPSSPTPCCSSNVLHSSRLRSWSGRRCSAGFHRPSSVGCGGWRCR
jgi:hypothetical protein